MTNPAWLNNALIGCAQRPATSHGILVGALRKVEGLHFDVAVLCHLTSETNGLIDTPHIQKSLQDALQALVSITHRLERLAHIE